MTDDARTTLVARPSVRRAALAGALLVAASVSACAGRTPTSSVGGAEPAAPMNPGEPSAPPTIASLPSLSVPFETLSEPMRQAWALTDEALALTPPPLPQDTSASSLERWSKAVFASWVGQKSAEVKEARHALDEAASQSPREQVLAGALAGLLGEDMGRALLAVPVPSDLEDEAAIAAAFRDISRFQASPYLEDARRAYRACAQNAEARVLRGSMARWRRYCEARGERLPAAPARGRSVAGGPSAGSPGGTPSTPSTWRTVVRWLIFTLT